MKDLVHTSAFESTIPTAETKPGKAAAYSAYHFDVQATAKAARANVNVTNTDTKEIGTA